MPLPLFVEPAFSSVFWHLLPPDAKKNRSSKEESARAVMPGKRGRCTSFPASAPSVLCYFYSSSACPVFISRLLMFPLCRMHQAGKQKAQIDPQNKTHDACRQYHCAASFLLPYFTIYHLSDAIAACRKRQDHCPTCKLFCAGALQDSAASAILLTALI